MILKKNNKYKKIKYNVYNKYKYFFYIKCNLIMIYFYLF